MILKFCQHGKQEKTLPPFSGDSKHLPDLKKIDVEHKTILDICTLYTVYKNLLNPHLIASTALEQTA